MISCVYTIGGIRNLFEVLQDNNSRGRKFPSLNGVSSVHYTDHSVSISHLLSLLH